MDPAGASPPPSSSSGVSRVLRCASGTSSSADTGSSQNRSIVRGCHLATCTADRITSGPRASRWQTCCSAVCRGCGAGSTWNAACMAIRPLDTVQSRNLSTGRGPRGQRTDRACAQNDAHQATNGKRARRASSGLPRAQGGLQLSVGVSPEGPPSTPGRWDIGNDRRRMNSRTVQPWDKLQDAAGYSTSRWA